MTIGFNEGFLHRILCVFHLTQHCQGDSKHTSLVTPYQSLKSLAVTAEDALNQPQILFGGVELLLRSFRHLQTWDRC